MDNKSRSCRKIEKINKESDFHIQIFTLFPEYTIIFSNSEKAVIIDSFCEQISNKFIKFVNGK